MRKKGQAGSILMYILIAVIVLLVQLMGYKAIKGIQDATCQSDLIGFSDNLENLGKGLSYGSIKHEELKIPCKSDKIYIVNNEKLLRENISIPSLLIQDSIEAGIAKNVFLTRKNIFETAHEAKRIAIGYPHYLCMKPIGGDVSLVLKTFGDKVTISSGCDHTDCTEIPVRPSEDEAKSIIEEFVEFGYSGECESCPAQTTVEVENYMETRKDFDVYRKFSNCAGKGLTKVEITINVKEKLENFYFYESIPKECIGSLKEYLAEEIEGDIKIKDDPLIMWHFDSIKEEAEVSYILKKELSDECKKMFKGLGLERLEEGVRQAWECQGTDSSCGAYPDCQNCNALDSFTGAPTCSGNNVIRSFNDYSCNNNACKASPAIKTVTTCTNEQTCQGGTCVGLDNPCTPHASRQCYNDGVYWYDSCDNRESMIEACDFGCSSGACNAEPETPPLCTDECSLLGQKQCSGDYSQTCVEDQDSCLVWNIGNYCEYGCSGGNCNSCTPNCLSWPDECSQSMPDGCGDTCTRITEGNSCQSGSGICKSKSCCIPSTWTPSPTTVCSGDPFTQTSNCGTTRQSTGTKSCDIGDF